MNKNKKLIRTLITVSPCFASGIVNAEGFVEDSETSTTEGREWERNTDIGYVVQTGALKNVGIKWRNASYRSSFARGIDENRLIVSYTLPIW